MSISTLPYFVKWIIVGTLIGVVAAVAALTFIYALELCQKFFLEQIVGVELPRPVGEGGLGNYTLTSERLWLLPVATGLGGLLSGLLVYGLAPEAEGHGTDAAINAYHRLRGRIRRRVPFVKLVASAVTIGSGGSAGREGPTAQLSAGLGSIIADILRLNDDDRRIVTMVAAGAGIGTIFKAPIGGALFAAEVLYKRDVESEVLFPALVAAIVGYAIYGAITGFTPVFGEVPAHFDVRQLPLFALLGLVSGAVAYVYVKVFYYFHDRFKSWHTSPYVKPLVGGLAVGALGIVAPQILGVGYGWVSLLIQESPSAFYSPILPAVLLIALLPLLKILATSLTVGSGGSGGVFAPGLVIGAFVGYDMYLVFKTLFPSLAPNAAPFIVVGMLSLFGAASKAPLATAIMVVEMTGSYDLLPAAIIAVAVARLVSGEDSLYRSQVPTRRDSPAHLEEYHVPLLMEMKVADCALDKEPVVKHDDDVKKAVTIMTTRSMSALPVVDDYGNFLGAVYLFELLGKSGRVGKYARKIPHVSPESSLLEALQVIGQTGLTWAPVVDDGKLIGVLTLQSINRAYTQRLGKGKSGVQ